MKLRILLACALFLGSAAAMAGRGPVQVFILAGQSNMEGKGAVSHLEGLIQDPTTSAQFRHLQNLDGKWVERKDVWISYGDRRGYLEPGYGSSGDKIGPELGFGWVMGENLKNQVLLIKTCWGGHSLKEKFLPPSSGGPGPSYTKMVEEVRDVLANLGRYFSDYDGQGYEMAGLVWHQAWNDMVDGSQKPDYPDYAQRQANLLRDLRREFNTPNMPMTIGECGTGGVSGRGKFQEAQEAMALMPEFLKTVRYVETAEFVETEERYKSDRPYHYNGSGRTYYLKGDAFGNAMLELIPRVKFSQLKPYLDVVTAPMYKALKRRKYPEAYAAFLELERQMAAARAGGDPETLEKRQVAFDVMELELFGAVEPVVAEIRTLKEVGDVYALSLIVPQAAEQFGGIDLYDQVAGGLAADLKTREAKAEIGAGKKFYAFIEKVAKVEAASDEPRHPRTAAQLRRHLRGMASKNPDSVYGRAAQLAAELLGDPGNAAAAPRSYLRPVK